MISVFVIVVPEQTKFVEVLPSKKNLAPNNFICERHVINSEHNSFVVVVKDKDTDRFVDYITKLGVPYKFAGHEYININSKQTIELEEELYKKFLEKKNALLSSKV